MVSPFNARTQGHPEAGNDERGVKSCVYADGSDEPRANRLQGKASIEMLGGAEWPESPGIGYAPLESRC